MPTAKGETPRQRQQRQHESLGTEHSKSLY